MKIAEYCGNLEFSILQFVCSITNDIHEKIVNKKLVYQEQIARYVQKQIDLFFHNQNMKTALMQTYKYETYNTIMFKLNNLIKENNIFRCV